MSDDGSIETRNVAERFAAAMQAQSIGQLDVAATIYTDLLRSPDAPRASILTNLAAIWLARQDWLAAETAAREALDTNPDLANAYNNLGSALIGQGRVDEAISAFEACVARDPIHDNAQANLSAAYSHAGRYDDALKAAEAAMLAAPEKYEEALSPAVYSKLDQALWNNLEPLIGHTLDSLNQGASIDPHLLFLISDDPEAMRQAARLTARKAAAVARTLPAWSAPPPNKGRYRIGYFSSALKAHATGFLIRELVAAHDPERVEVIAYPHRPAPVHPFTTALRNSFERVVDLSEMSDHEALLQLREDRLDVLLCINGYSGQPRSAILEARAAPVQVNWLGFPATMGSTAINYIIADDSVLPRALEPYFDEKPARLSGGYFPADSRRPISDRFKTRADLGFPETGVIMGALNQARKVTPFMADLWARVLQGTEDAYLLLWETSPEAMQNLRRELAAHGAPPNRILTTPSLILADHLCRYRFIDMFLDAWPCNGHTMTNDALFMNVPGVTLRGRSFAARVAGSLLERVGLPRLIAETADDYVDLAVRIANDHAWRSVAASTIKDTAAKNQTFSGARYARQFEAALATMADRARRGLPPAAINV